MPVKAEAKDQIYKWRGRMIRYAPVILWISVIFFLSGSSGSMTETSRFIGPLVEFFFPNISDGSMQSVHFFIRKSAHFIEYAVLAFFIVRAFSKSSIEFLRRLRFVLPVLFVAMIAAADEINQSFVTSRSSSGWDSLIDIAGGTAMTVGLWIMRRRRRF